MQGQRRTDGAAAVRLKEGRSVVVTWVAWKTLVFMPQNLAYMFVRHPSEVQSSFEGVRLSGSVRTRWSLNDELCSSFWRRFTGCPRPATMRAEDVRRGLSTCADSVTVSTSSMNTVMVPYC